MSFRLPTGDIIKKTNLKYPQEQCTYKNYCCTHPRLDNYAFCVRHILEDKTAPYKQCNYIFTSVGRRCPLPAPKHDRRDSFCADHVRKLQQKQLKQTGIQEPPVTVDGLLLSLSHYVKKPDIGKDHKDKHEYSEASTENSFISGYLTSEGSEKGTGQKSLNPYVDINAEVVNSSVHKVLEYCSESDSDVDITTIERTARGKDEDSSDAESIDSAGEDIFRHANIFTDEEVVLRAKEKMIKLQTLYIDQFKRLQHVLKERRRDYLHALQTEKETLSSISNQPHTTVKEQKLYEKLKGLIRYHKRFGVEALLYKKQLERRAHGTDGTQAKPLSASAKCIYTEGGVKCSQKTLPCAKFCLKHILEDPHQMLFKPCGVNKGEATCQEPVLHVFSYENCVFHFNMPAVQWSFNTRLSSEDEEEDPSNKRLKLETGELGSEAQPGQSGEDMKEEELVVKTEMDDSSLYSAFPGQQSLEMALHQVLPDTADTRLRKLPHMEELPLQIMESKELSSEEQTAQPDDIYYMGVGDLFQHQTVNIQEECMVNYDSEQTM